MWLARESESAGGELVLYKNLPVLNDITDDDCMNEGIRTGRCGNDEHGWMDAYYYDKQPFCTAKKAFASLIDKVSGNGTWEKNPAVVVYYFELIN